MSTIECLSRRLAKNTKVNPVNDLIPVCPNCHWVIHLSDPPQTVEEVKALLQKR